jgi:hypothetical protein
MDYLLTIEDTGDVLAFTGESEVSAWLAGYAQDYLQPGSTRPAVRGIWACERDGRVELEWTLVQERPEGDHTDWVWAVCSTGGKQLYFTFTTTDERP